MKYVEEMDIKKIKHRIQREKESYIIGTNGSMDKSPCGLGVKERSNL